MRNGDFTPTRLSAQHDAVNLIADAKTAQNPESAVGILAMGGDRGTPEVLTTLTPDVGRVIQTVSKIKIAPKCDFLRSLKVAQLALKHRQNKNQHQRIVMFVGSPIEADEKTVVNVAKGLRKNGIAVDVVNFGEEDYNSGLLEAFIGAVNNNDNSHLLTIPSGNVVLSDVILSSALVRPEGAPEGAGAGPAAFGVDPNLDPELALALRLSMEEEQVRQTQSAPAPTAGASNPAPAGVPATTAAPPTDAMEVDDLDADLAAALALSVQSSSEHTSTPVPAPTPANGDKMDMVPDAYDDEDLKAALAMSVQPGAKHMEGAEPTAPPSKLETLTEDEQLQMALQMSMNAGTAAPLAKPAAAPMPADPSAAIMQDSEFLASILSSLPGVDASDANIQNVLNSLKGDKKDEKKE